MKYVWWKTHLTSLDYLTLFSCPHVCHLPVAANFMVTLSPAAATNFISTLHRKPYKQELHRMRANRVCTGSEATSAPPCRPALLSKIHPSLKLKYCRYIDTGSDMPTTPSGAWTDLGKSRFLRHRGKLRRPTSWMASPIQGSLSTPRPSPTPDCTDVYTGRLKPTALRTLR